MTNTVKHSTESKIQTNGITIAYDTFGESKDPPLLLIMGLGRQMIFWDEAFCSQLASHKRFVIRFDNRDMGLSTHLDTYGIPSITDILGAISKGQRPAIPYRLEDMATDVVGLMDALQLESAHLVGASMGGSIVQILALEHAERVRTAAIIMSSAGDPLSIRPSKEVSDLLLTPAPAEREAYAQYSVESAKLLSGSGFPVNEERIRTMALKAFDRNFNPTGFARQYAAIITAGSRRDRLQRLDVPTLVIHGEDDPLVPVEAGTDLAAIIPGAKLEIIKGMGHDLPAQVWPHIIQLIVAHTQKS